MSGPTGRTGSDVTRPRDDGANQVWGLISTLVAGPAVWGAVGLGADRLLDSSLFAPLGVVVGFVTSFYIVYVRTAQAPADRTTPPRPLPPREDSAPSPDAARPEPGDVR